MLLNRFYLRELPGEHPATAALVKHQAVIEEELWEAALTPMALWTIWRIAENHPWKGGFAVGWEVILSDLMRR